MHHCYDIDGVYVLMIYQDHVCYTWDHLIHISISLTVSIIFIIIAMVAAMALFETKCTSKDLMARSNSRAIVF